MSFNNNAKNSNEETKANDVLLSIEEINKIIDDEIKYAKEVTPYMAIGMLQIKKQINNYAGDKNDI